MLVLVLGAGAGAGAVSWLCTWCRQGAGAGCTRGAWRQGAGAGARTWWRQGVGAAGRARAGAGAGCWLAGCVRGGDRVLGAGAARLLCAWWRQGAGAVCWVRAVSWLRRWWRHGAGAGWVLGVGPGAGAVSWLYARNIIRCCRLSILCLLALWGIYPLEVLFWPTAVSRAVLFARAYFCTYNVVCATSGSQPTILSACFSMLHTQ